VAHAVTELFGVGQSKVKTWRNCRRAYHHKYVEGLQRRRTKRPLMFGKIIHRMLEAHAQEDEDPFEVLRSISFENEKLFTAEREMYGDIVEDVETIMREYFDYHADGLRMVPVPDETGELRFGEHEFAVPLADLAGPTADGIVFKGQVDGLGRTPNRLRWLVETKTHDKRPDDDERWRNVQTIVYRRVVLHLGWMSSLDGVCWNYVMSKAPTVPRVLKDGTRLSNQAVTTLPSVVRRALAEASLRPEDHDEILQRAVETRREYFQRIYCPVSETISDRIFDGFVESACEMRDTQGRGPGPMNVGRHCSWCDYEPLCRAELTGGDVDFVKQGEYTVEDPEAYRRTKRDSRAAGGETGGGASSERPRGKRAPELRVLRPKRNG